MARQSSTAKFQALTKREQRLAIARDVIAQLDAQTIIAQTGVYVESPELFTLLREASPETEVRSVLPQVGEPCEACAVGSMFLCAVGLGDDLKVKRLDIGDEEAEQLDGDDAHRYMRRYFSRKQLGLIESAFESIDMTNSEDTFNSDAYHERVQDAIRFGQLFNEGYLTEERDSANRLRAIMENIIVNDGTFRPEIQPKQRWVTDGYVG